MFKALWPHKTRFLGAILLLFSFALAEGVEDWYKDKPITGLPFYMRKLPIPYVVVRDLLRQKENKTSEWYLIVSPLDKSQEASKGIRKAWQRLEERLFWRAMLLLNMPNALPCSLSGDRLGPPIPEATVSFLKEYLPPEYPFEREEIPVASRKALRLDSYTAFEFMSASVAGDDFCHDLGPLDYLPVYLPKTCFRLLRDWCLGPIFFENLINARRERTLQDLSGRYIPDYFGDVEKALMANLPTITRWSGFEIGSGVAITPVMKIGPEASLTEVPEDYQKIVEALKSVEWKDDKLKDAVWIYYMNALRDVPRRYSGLPIPSPESLIPALPVVKDALSRTTMLDLLVKEEYRNSPLRGIWPFEEIKRLFPPSDYKVHETLGYTTYYQVFTTLEVTILPDPSAGWAPGEYVAVAAMRNLHVWVPYTVFCPRLGWPPIGICEAGVNLYFIAPYVLPYVGPRYLWDWVSVPEGYPIPRVQGIPIAVPVPKH